MFKRFLSLALIGLVFNLGSVAPASAATKAEKEAQFAEKVRAGVAKLGTGTDARVEVRLRDKRKFKGYVSEAGADSFSVVDAKTGATTHVAYPQVKSVKGNNLSEGARIAIGVGIAVVVIIVLASLSST